MNLAGPLGFGDSAQVYLTAIAPDGAAADDDPAHGLRDDSSYGETLPDRRVNIIDRIDPRLILADFRALMRART